MKEDILFKFKILFLSFFIFQNFFIKTSNFGFLKYAGGQGLEYLKNKGDQGFNYLKDGARSLKLEDLKDIEYKKKFKIFVEFKFRKIFNTIF